MNYIRVFNKSVIISSLISLFLFACGAKQASDEWGRIVYYYNVGSLPPEYQYSYKIVINSDGKCELIYTKGYENEDGKVSNYPYELDNEKLEKIKNAIKESDVLNLDIKTRPNEEIPDGGHTDCLQIYGFNNDDSNSNLPVLKSIPLYPELKYTETLNKLYKAIQSTVPEEIWNKAKSKDKK